MDPLVYFNSTYYSTEDIRNFIEAFRVVVDKHVKGTPYILNDLTQFRVGYTQDNTCVFRNMTFNTKKTAYISFPFKVKLWPSALELIAFNHSDIIPDTLFEGFNQRLAQLFLTPNSAGYAPFSVRRDVLNKISEEVPIPKIRILPTADPQDLRTAQLATMEHKYQLLVGSKNYRLLEIEKARETIKAAETVLEDIEKKMTTVSERLTKMRTKFKGYTG